MDIAIVGAGIAGLAAGIQLTRAGHRVHVLERFASAQPVGSGLILQPTGLAAMARLGLQDAINARGHRIDGIRGITDRGTTVFDVQYADLAPDMRALAVHRAALHGVLWDAFSASGAGIETNCTITATARDANGRVALTDTNGRCVMDADLVIDASGAQSALRAAVDPGRVRPFTYGAVWATVDDIGLAPHQLAQRYVAARIMVGYLPVGVIAPGGSPKAAFFWSLKPNAHDAWRANFNTWKRDVTTLWPELAPTVAGFAAPEDLTLAQYNHFAARRLWQNGVVLIGDAAHTTSPQLGQGANQGLIDALVLADALAAEPKIEQAALRYARRRRRHVRFYQFASALMTPFFQSDTTALAWLRDATFNRMRHVPYLRREMVRTLAGLKTGILTSASPQEIAEGK